jgi:hypothetical protein
LSDCTANIRSVAPKCVPTLTPGYMRRRHCNGVRGMNIIEQRIKFEFTVTIGDRRFQKG